MPLQLLELHPEERALRTHIQRQTLEYARHHITTDHIWYTEAGVAEVFTSSLNEISPYAPIDVSFPVDPLQKILCARDLPPYDEQLVLSGEERDETRKVIAESLAACKGGASQCGSWCAMKSEDPNVLETPRRPLSPILTARARHQTPRILHRSKAQIVGMLPMDMEESLDKARIYPVVVEDVQEERIQPESYLNIQYTMSKDEADEFRAIFTAATSKIKVKKPPSGFIGFLRAESPVLAAYFPRPMSPPLFPRGERLNLGAEPVQMGLEEAISLAGIKKARIEDGFGLDEIAQQQMRMISGKFDFLPPSSPLPPLHHQIDSTSSDAVQPSSPPRTPSRIQASERAFMVPSSPSVKEDKITKLDEIIFPSDQQRGRKLPPRKDAPRFPDTIEHLHRPIPTYPKTNLVPLVATILVPGSPSISNESMASQFDEEEEIDELADDHSAAPSRALSRRTSKATSRQKASQPVPRRASHRSEIDELANDDALINTVIDHLTRGIGKDPFECIMKEKLDERDALTFDVPELPPPNVSKIPIEPEPDSLSKIVGQLGIHRVGMIKSLQIELGWRVTMPGQALPHEQAADVLSPADPEAKSIIKQFRAELKSGRADVFCEEQKRESIQDIGTGKVWGDGMIMTREEQKRIDGQRTLLEEEPTPEVVDSRLYSFESGDSPGVTPTNQVAFAPYSFGAYENQNSSRPIGDGYPSVSTRGEPTEYTLTETYYPSMALAQDLQPLEDDPLRSSPEGLREYEREKVWVDDSGYFDDDMEGGRDEVDQHWFEDRPQQEITRRADERPRKHIGVDPVEPDVEQVIYPTEFDAPEPIEVPRLVNEHSREVKGALEVARALERELAMDILTIRGPLQPNISQHKHSAQDQLARFMYVANGKVPDLTPAPNEPIIPEAPPPSQKAPDLYPIPEEAKSFVTLSPEGLDTSNEPEPFRILANMYVMHHRALVSALEHPTINLQLIERSLCTPCDTVFTWAWQDTSTALQGASFVLDPDTALVILPLAELASPDAVPALSRLLQSLLTRFEWVGVVLEAYARPRPRSLRTDIEGEADGLALNPFTPPALKSLSALRRALALLHNSLGLVPIAGTGGVEVGIGRTVQESAKIIRCAVDRAATSWRAREGREKEVWGSREWIGVDENENEEQELSTVPRMNVFAAVIILAQATVDEFLSISGEKRMRVFGPSVTEEKIAMLNEVIAQGQARMQIIRQEPTGAPEEDMAIPLTTSGWWSTPGCGYMHPRQRGAGDWAGLGKLAIDSRDSVIGDAIRGPPDPGRKLRSEQVVNVIVYFAFLGSNIYTIAGPEDAYRSGKETYFTPAPWAFAIWSLIHLLLLGYIIYQFFDNGKKTIIDGVGWRFPLLAVLNLIYVNVWTKGHYIVAFIFALFVSSTVSHIYYIVKKYHSSENINDELWIHLPFSLYHGWTTVLVVVTAFEAFGVNALTHKAGIFTKVFVFLGLLFLEATAAAYAFQSTEGDVAASIAITWSLFAIFEHQRSSAFVHWSALAFAIISLFSVLKSLYGLATRGRSTSALHDEERSPLVSGS